MPSPWSVLVRLSTLWQVDGFWQAVGFSISRITVGFLLALLGGALLAIGAARFPILEILLSPYMLTVKSVPVASFIVLMFTWFSPSSLSGFIAALIVLPTVYNNLLAGLRSVDRQMLEMAEVFRFSFWRRLLAVYLPHLRPYVLSACSLAAGLAWKSGVAAEIIAVPNGSIGNMICVNNVVAACATAGTSGKEGKIIRINAIPTAIYSVLVILILAIALFILKV